MPQRSRFSFLVLDLVTLHLQEWSYSYTCPTDYTCLIFNFSVENWFQKHMVLEVKFGVNSVKTWSYRRLDIKTTCPRNLPICSYCKVMNLFHTFWTHCMCTMSANVENVSKCSVNRETSRGSLFTNFPELTKRACYQHNGHYWRMKIWKRRTE